MAQKPLKTTQVAERLAVDERTVRRWLSDGRVPAIRTPGGHWRIPEVALTQLLPKAA